LRVLLPPILPDEGVKYINPEVFVASFSSAENLKSQWDEYSDKGNGISIGFDLRQIRPPKSLQSAVTLAPCIYEQKDAEILLRVAFGHYFRSAVEGLDNTASSQWVKQMVDGSMRVARIFGKPFDEGAYRAAMEEEFLRRLRRDIALTRFDLLRIASHCKRPNYRKEQEWRLALPHTKDTPMTHVKIEYRGPRHNIPYIAHNLFQAGRLPITQVMAGPFCEAAAVGRLLAEHGYAVAVTKSSSPAGSPDQV
jgi:hypothetical protein